MVLQKRLEFGFSGYEVPPTPRAPRSARRRVSSWKKADESNQMCAFDLLATVAGKLSQEGDTSLNTSANKSRKEETKVVKDSIFKTEEQNIEEDECLNVNICDQGSCSRSFFVSEIISQDPVVDEVNAQNDTYSGPPSGITVSDCSEKVLPAPKSLNGESRIIDFSINKVKVPFGCKVDNENMKQIRWTPSNVKSPIVNNLDNNSVKLPFCNDHSPHGRLPLGQDNVNLAVRDDDEQSAGCPPSPNLNNTTFRPPPRIGDRRIKRLLASRCWKGAPKSNDESHFKTAAELKPVYSNRKTCYKQQRSLRDYPFKKRRLYEVDKFSNSDGGVSSDDRPSSPRKESIEDGSCLDAKSEGGMRTPGLAAIQNPALHARDSHLKLKVKSFKVPELFIEIPETATVGFLKRTVMEAVTAILSVELQVGVILHGKKIRDDNKTLLQTGICHDNNIDTLGFSLEPKRLQVPSSPLPEDQPQSLAPPPDRRQTLTRHSLAPTVANSVVVQHEVSDGSPDPPVTIISNLIESDHDSAPSAPEILVDYRSVSDSRALVPLPAMNTGALVVVPMRKSKRAEVAQRRIRRPFSVSEVEALVQAVEKLGTGRWRDVKLRAFDNVKHRTYVDLKDKWKTLVHTARISPQQRRGEPVPQDLLDRVLAAQAYWSHHQAKQQFKQQQETWRRL